MTALSAFPLRTPVAASDGKTRYTRPLHERVYSMQESDQRAWVRFQMSRGKDTQDIADMLGLDEAHIWNLLRSGDSKREVVVDG